MPAPTGDDAGVQDAIAAAVRDRTPLTVSVIARTARMDHTSRNSSGRSRAWNSKQSI
ncbi:hypothetical protein [Streptomyces deserti]